MKNNFDWVSLKFLVQEIQMSYDMAIHKVENYPVQTRIEIERIKKEIVNSRDSEKIKK